MPEPVILHCDLDHYFASVSLLSHPELAGKPVAVCGDPEKRHGIVLAKNPMAKKFGVTTGETVNEAMRKCPYLNILAPDYPLYMEYSERVRGIYTRYTGHIESFGIDECWLDITPFKQTPGIGETTAHAIQQAVSGETGLSVSIGVSWNKIFAKLGSDMHKPSGITIINRENYRTSVWSLPVDDLMFVGRATKRKLFAVGITTIGELANAPVDFLRSLFGKNGITLHEFANGSDLSPVKQVDHETDMKGIGNSMTTVADLTNHEEVKEALYIIAEMVSRRMVRHHVCGRVVSIFLRDNRLSSLTRQKKLNRGVFVSGELAEEAMKLYYQHWDISSRPIRAIGIRVSGLAPLHQFRQLSFFDDLSAIKREDMEFAKERIREKYGYDCIQRALLLRHTVREKNPAEQHIVHPVSYFGG
jgi:DNA polymerase-4